MTRVGGLITRAWDSGVKSTWDHIRFELFLSFLPICFTSLVLEIRDEIDFG